MARILAIDSSGLVASVAVVEEDVLLAEYTVNYKKTHSETLLPMIDAVMRMLDTDVSTMDAIAVAAGPGSFTGLRIGAATAKGLALALDKPLIGVPTIDALAYNLCSAAEGVVVPILDARREQVYTGIYRFSNGEMEVVCPQWAAGIDELIDLLNARMSGSGTAEECSAAAAQVPVTFLGDGVPVFRERLEKELRMPVTFAPAHQNRQRAAAVGVLAQQYLAEGKTVASEEFAPVYLRLSQAERERLEREQQETGG